MHSFRVVTLGKWDNSNELPPLVGTSAATPVANSNRYSHRSIETLVVVLAVITIAAVIAGVIARMCGGRHLGGSGEHDVEGWVERNCRSCLDSGLPPPAEPAVEEAKPAASTEGEKK